MTAPPDNRPMFTRRRFLQGSLLTAALPFTGLPPFISEAFATDATPAARTGLTSFVDVFIGTGGHGHTYPGATLPFGMVQLSPDTYNASWDASSGYHYGDRSIMGFSHTHLSGTGASDLLDFLVMPGVGAVQTRPGVPDWPLGHYSSRFDAVHPSTTDKPAAAKPAPGYRSTFSHADEHATPGYYRVMLRDRQVLAELTATTRAGMHRYTFPASGQSHVLVDLAHGYQDYPDKRAPVSHASLRVVGQDTLLGGRTTEGWAHGRQLYFAMKFSRPFERFDVFSAKQPHGASDRETTDPDIRCAVHFSTHAGEQVLVKVGISGVSEENALANLDAEMPDWDFEHIRAMANAAWEKELARIRIDAWDDKHHRRMFYTGLYHSLLAPTVFSDVDGRYRGMDRAVHQLADGALNYSTFSLWDTYRALHPLLTLVQPERVPGMVNTLIRMADESPDGVPVWPLQGRETGCMTGYHSAVVVAEAQAKGFKGIDYARAWPLWQKRAMQDDYRGLRFYRDMGYIPADRIDESASKTLEYAYDDWAVAHLARGTGHQDDYVLLRERSHNYRHLFDAKAQFIRPRMSDGSWAEPFDPTAMGHSDRWRDFTESNAWQATFLNQHDVHAYIDMFGGDEAFANKLDALFQTHAILPANAPPDIAGLIGQYAHGNEPSHHIAYLYTYAGQAWKTQARVREILQTLYADAPDGEAGNDDCGQISAWYLMSAMGLYAVDPVSANYVFGSPLLRSAQLDLGGDRTLTIEAENNGPDTPYVQSVHWNGQPYNRNWIPHTTLAQGGHLQFTMGPTPNKTFGTPTNTRPPQAD
jgi:predicted alpha-1,2-mannosidase